MRISTESFVFLGLGQDKLKIPIAQKEASKEYIYYLNTILIFSKKYNLYKTIRDGGLIRYQI